MNGQMLLESVRETKQTELDRLRSDKALLAATGANLDAETILGEVALTLDGLRKTFREWQADTVTDTEQAFAAAADRLETEYDSVLAALEDTPEGDPPVALATVRQYEVPTERVAAGLVGHGLVFEGTLLQVVSFFVNEADEHGADLARDLRSTTNDRIETGARALDGLCTAESDWKRAETTACDVIEAAYHDYAETLGEMGIDPKPVC